MWFCFTVCTMKKSASSHFFIPSLFMSKPLETDELHLFQFKIFCCCCCLLQVADVKGKLSQFRSFWSSLPGFVCQDENVAARVEDTDCWDVEKQSWCANNVIPQSSEGHFSLHTFHTLCFVFFFFLNQEHHGCVWWRVNRLPDNDQHAKACL